LQHLHCTLVLDVCNTLVENCPVICSDGVSFVVIQDSAILILFNTNCAFGHVAM